LLLAANLQDNPHSLLKDSPGLLSSVLLHFLYYGRPSGIKSLSVWTSKPICLCSSLVSLQRNSPTDDAFRTKKGAFVAAHALQIRIITWNY